jgi:hypothetical protein
MFQKPRTFIALWIWFIGKATIRFSGQSKTSPAHGQVEGESGFNATQNHFDNSSWRSKLRAALDGVLAQLVEHHNGIVGVKGSNPLGSTISNELKCLMNVLDSTHPKGRFSFDLKSGMILVYPTNPSC